MAAALSRLLSQIQGASAGPLALRRIDNLADIVPGTISARAVIGIAVRALHERT